MIHRILLIYIYIYTQHVLSDASVKQRQYHFNYIITICCSRLFQDKQALIDDTI